MSTLGLVLLVFLGSIVVVTAVLVELSFRAHSHDRRLEARGRSEAAAARISRPGAGHRIGDMVCSGEGHVHEVTHES